jgi:Mn-dependent DtxR family transcriptional regulator
MSAYSRSKMSQHYGAHVTPEQARQVWAHLTNEPRTSMDEIARGMGVSKSIVRAARELLRDAGYVNYEDGKPRTTTILVPFRVMRKRRSPVRS